MCRSLLVCCVLLPALAVAGAPAGERATGSSFAAHLTKVHPSCDHMPIMQKGERRQYLIASITLKNKTRGSQEVKLERASISFDPADEGAPVTGLSVKGADGRPSGKTSITLAPGAELKVELRGDNLYPEGKHDQTLYLTLVLAAGRDRLVVRGSGRVLGTM
jgi:hypothetical protein